ncbi:MAG: DUF2726 domain-containing protein [Bacteroidota bacterium]
MKKILNATEARVNEQLKKICEEFEAHVWVKERLADVLKIENSGIDNHAYSYALKSHFDFIISDKEFIPLFGVEFDGPTHNQAASIENDKIKNQLCEKFGFPLLRIRYNYLETRARGMDFLTWLIEVWFSEQSFNEEQQAGNIPYDESFDPLAILYQSKKNGAFPYRLSLPHAIQIEKLAKEGKCQEPVLSSMIASDKEGNLRGLGFIKVNDKGYAFAETAMRAQSFPFASDLFDEIVQIETHGALLKILNGDGDIIAPEFLDERIKNFQNNYELRRASGYGSKIGDLR